MAFAAGINSVSRAGAAFQSSSHSLRQCDTAVSMGNLEAQSPCILQKANDEMVLLVFDEPSHVCAGEEITLSFSAGLAQCFKELTLHL